MRISRKKRPQKLLIPIYRRNEGIAVPQVRLIDADGNNLGVFATNEAIRMARQSEMDLVEINPKAEPPVAQIIEFTHFKYQKEKEARKQRANAHVSEIKGIRLSVRIGEHDMTIRQAQAEKFLERGDKVRAEIILRGREHARVDLAYDVIRRFIAMIETNIPVRYDQEITKQANKVTAIVAKK